MHQDDVRLGQIIKDKTDGSRYLVVHTERGGPHKTKSARTGWVFAEEQHRFGGFDVESEPLDLDSLRVGDVLVDFEGNKASVVGQPEARHKYREVSMLADGELRFFNQRNLSEVGFRLHQRGPFVAPPAQPEPKVPTVTVPTEPEIPNSRLLITVNADLINTVVARELETLVYPGDHTLDDIATEAIERDLAILLDVEATLKNHRESEDITQDTVARRCEVPAAFISMIERGALTKLVAYLQERK